MAESSHWVEIRLLAKNQLPKDCGVDKLLFVQLILCIFFKGCERVSYCSENCQLLDWRIHGIKCRQGRKEKKKEKRNKKKKTDVEKELTSESD